jgi:mannobiose 2-epimerase
MRDELQKVKEEFKKDLIENILPFWMTRTVDHRQGGFVGGLEFDGSVKEQAPKGSVLNARILWAFSAAARASGVEADCKDLADRAYEYLVTRFIDGEYGGVFWKLDHTGAPMETKNQIYALAFTVYALAEYYKLNRDTGVLERASGLFRVMEKYSYDPVKGGYFEAFSRDWKPVGDLRLSEIDDNEQKTLNTHLHILEAYTALYSVWPDQLLGDRLRELCRLFTGTFISPDRTFFNLFYDENWQLKSRRISPGHDIETTWLLLEAARILDDSRLISGAEEICLSIAASVAKTGFDESGGLVYERTPEKITNYNKEWWCQAEALVGFVNAWEISGDPSYAATVVRVWEFIDRFFIDRTAGEWHYRVDRKGHPDVNEEKVGFWKCPYHTVRACLELSERISRS